MLRYIGAAFLLAWLAGWAVGEAFALGALVMVVRSLVGSAIGTAWPIPGGEWIAGGATGFVVTFLLIWLILWTFGGVAAMRELFRAVAGEDSVSVESMNVELVRRAGPFRRTRVFERSHVRGVRLRRHDKAVVLDTATGTEEITTYGTADDRRAMAEWLRSRLLLPPEPLRVDASSAPPGWTMTAEGAATAITQEDATARRIAASILWCIVLVLAAISYGGEGSAAGRAIGVTLTIVFIGMAAWLTLSRRHWLVRHGALTRRTRFVTWEKLQEFRNARLEVEQRSDSDNDDHFTLYVIGSDDRRKIATELNDDRAVVDLARWLEARTGFRVALPPKLR